MGYTTVSRKVTFEGKPLELGKVVLKAGLELEKVVVKPLIRRESDRIVFNVGDDPDAAKMKMMEIMHKIPMLEMNPGDGKLVYEGAPISKILFDDRDDGMISASRQYPMDFIKANVMYEIELILPGSPEYDNDRPMLNIKLARPLPNGIAWEITPRADTRRNYGVGLDLVTKTNLTGIGLNYGFGYSNPIKLGTELQRFNLQDNSNYYQLNERSESWSTLQNHSFGINLFRPLFKERVKFNISASTDLSQGDSYTDSKSEKLDREGALIENQTSSSKNHTMSPMRFNGGVSISQYLGKSRKSSYSLKYTYTDNKNESTQQTQTTSTGEQDASRKSEGETGTEQHVVNFSLLLRPKDRRSPKSLYTYVNYISRAYTNSTDYYVYDYPTDDYIVDQERFNGLTYQQNIFSAKIAVGNSFFNRMLSYRADLNVENINSKGVYLSYDNAKLDYSEFNLLPSLSLSYKLKKWVFQTNYKTRVRRPDVMKLNPFIDDSNPNNISMGNPNLKGEYAHRLYGSISKGFKSKFIKDVGVSYSADFVNNAITRLSTINEDNISVTSYSNVGKTRQQFANFNFTISPAKFIFVMGSVGYMRSNYYLSGGINTIEGIYGRARMYIDVTKNDKLEVIYNIQPAYASAQSRHSSYSHTVDMSLSKYFSKAHIGGSIGVYDILSSNKMMRETTGNDIFMQYSRRQKIGRSARISLYWRFGRFKDADKPESVKGDVYDMD